ncbi:trypsin-like serine peptidase [Vibrio agarivorans]|uniref:trypsin-like serine peptidase n=1 Tax=Vibrio agarivorans TaxID=153622 RepID=UPI0025B40880|nr:trypsin-like serine protease [Vibrio agarivorans]MDN3659651.1 trypsin-like serine protease [Vibrio agarivorans]
MKALYLMGIISGVLLNVSWVSAKTPAIDAIGWLEAGNKQCTATIVRSHQIVTAAHCLYDNKTRSFFPPSKIQFFAGFASGDYRLSSFAKDYTVGLKSLPKGEFDEALIYNDWAVITLSTAVGCSIDPIDIDKDSFKNTSLSMFGYGNSGSGKLLAMHDCQYALPPRDKTGLRIKNCDIELGYSGGPLLRKRSNKWVLVGVISAEAEDSKGRIRQVAVPNIAFRNKLKPSACRRY